MSPLCLSICSIICPLALSHPLLSLCSHQTGSIIPDTVQDWWVSSQQSLLFKKLFEVSLKYYLYLFFTRVMPHPGTPFASCQAVPTLCFLFQPHSSINSSHFWQLNQTFRWDHSQSQKFKTRSLLRQTSEIILALHCCYWIQNLAHG